MLTRKKPIRSRTKRTRRKRSKFITPDLALVRGKLMPFVAGPDDPLSGAERLGEEYAELEDDHDAAVREFLQRAYRIADQFRRRRGDFERLQVHAFWKQSGQKKPRDPKKSKRILFFILRATTTEVRDLNKYAVILDGLRQDQVEISAVAERIEELGGIKAAYEVMRARKRANAQVSGTVAAAETAVASRRTRRDDESLSCKIGESVMPTKLIRRNWPQRTLEDVEAAHEAKHGLPTMIGEEGAFDFVQRLAQEYAEIKDGDHQAVRRVLQRAYFAVREMHREPDELERLRADRFWKPPWRRPKDPSTAKWVMYFIVQARSPKVRELADKYAEILDRLKQENVEIGAVSGRIKELSGIEAAYAAMRARTTQDSQNKQTLVWKSKQPASPTTQTVKPTVGFDPLYFDERGYYIIGSSGQKIRFDRPKPPRPPRKPNDFDRWGKRISQCQAQLPQARTQEERDRLNKEIRILEQLIQRRRAKVLDRRLAARTKRRLGWKSISGPL